jgi:hypothetical protein
METELQRNFHFIKMIFTIVSEVKCNLYHLICVPLGL